MSQIPRLLRALSEPLAIEPTTGRLLAHLFLRHLAGERLNGAMLHAALGIPTPEERPPQAEPARIAVIPIHGILAQHPQSLGASTEMIGARFDAALARRDIEGILFEVDSPGGTVGGTPELAAKIFAARGQKPILAIANGLMASAAYWIASAADEVWVTPSGDVGSIGVYTVHEDWSEALKAEGVKITPVSYGKYKLEGVPWEPLSEEAKDHLRARVDFAGNWFTKDVAAHRKDTQTAVRSGYGEGRVLGAEQAVKANLADTVGTVEQALARLAEKINRSAQRGRSAWVQREELALDS